MRLFSIAMLGLLSTAFAGAETTAGAPKILKADFVKEVAVNDVSKLLGSVADGLYWHKKEGVIEVRDRDGKLLRMLPTKEGKESILKQPEAIAAGDDVIYVVDSDVEQVAVFS